MKTWIVTYSDEIEIEAETEDEAIQKAIDIMFCDGAKDYRFDADEINVEDDDKRS